MTRDDILQSCRQLLLIAFVAVGTRAIFSLNLRSLTNSKLHGFAPNATTDAIIKELLAQSDPQIVTLLDKESDPTEAIRSAIASLPKNGAILFVGSPQDPGYLQMRLIINYLSWPHPVYAPACGWPYAWDTPPDSAQIAGTIYYLVHPPPKVVIVKEPIPRITITTVSEKLSWDSYCAH